MSILTRTVLIGFVLMLVFGLFEQWPGRLPRWLARWLLQVLGVAVAVPLVAAVIYAPPLGDGRYLLARGFNVRAAEGFGWTNVRPDP